MTTFSTEFKVGIFVLIVLAVLSIMTFKVGDIDWFRREGFVIYVYFSDIAGLDRNTKVRIAGVDAGVIESIELERNIAKLTLRMFPGVILFSDTEASIKAKGLLGEKYLALKPGSEEPVLKDGDYITDVKEILSLEEAMRKLSTISESVTRLTDNLNDVVGTEETKQALRDTFKNLRTITRKLDTTITENDKRLRRSLDNINRLAESLQKVVDENSVPLRDTLANVKDFSETLKTDGPELVKNIKDTTQSLKEISAKIEKGEGTLGKLVKDDKLYTRVSDAAEGLGRTVSKIERFRTFLTFQGEYLTRLEEGKGFFHVTLQPREDKYYILGIVSDPLGQVDTTTITTTEGGVTTVREEEETKKRLQFTAQFAKRFDNTALRVGLTENTFGVGADQFFMNDKLKLTSDIWDFTGDEEEADNPHVKIGAELFVFKRLFLSAGYDNIFNSNRAGFYAGGGVRFEDDDFKYLLSTVPVPTN